MNGIDDTKPATVFAAIEEIRRDVAEMKAKVDELHAFGKQISEVMEQVQKQGIGGMMSQMMGGGRKRG